METIVPSGVTGKENQKFLRQIHEMWKKTELLRQITLECTNIYPAKTNAHFSKRAQIKVCSLGYELAENYKLLISSDELYRKILKYTLDLKKLWKDANSRGIAPLTETQIILFLIKELKSDLKKIKLLSKPNYLENVI